MVTLASGWRRPLQGIPPPGAGEAFPGWDFRPWQTAGTFPGWESVPSGWTAVFPTGFLFSKRRLAVSPGGAGKEYLQFA